MRAYLLVALLVLSQACAANVPPNLSPQAATAWRLTRIVHTLDEIRNIAVSANEQTPPLLNEATTRQIVLWHQASIQIIQAQPAGWRQMVIAGLAGLIDLLPANDYAQLRPYIQIARAALLEFQ